MITDSERLEWCEGILFNAAAGGNTGWLVTDTGCGCCGEGVSIMEGVNFRDAIDAQILQESFRKTRAERIAELQAEIDRLLAADSEGEKQP